MEDYRKYLDPKTLNKIARLDLRARLIVEGYIAGLHKSPYHGYSVEFAEHREYTPGDDIRHIDWKVFGRTDRFYIKQYEEETNLVAHLVLDVSESMDFTSDGVTKLSYGQMISAALAYLIVQQQDAAGLILFDDEIRANLPPGSHGSHLRALFHSLSQVEPRKKTDVGRILNEVAQSIQKRGLVILISDLFDDPERVMAGLRHLVHRRHDVILFHVLDEAELSFPFERMTRFLGLEELGELVANPRSLREGYLAEIDSFRRKVRRSCTANRIDYVLMSTATTLDVALSSYLAKRAGTK
ncbi:MAG: DUF58 domain-containing protein [Planctomycetota bacterium]|jgi:uncharacterized protein (DUF58 family)